jgi:hypothetical protein
VAGIQLAACQSTHDQRDHDDDDENDRLQVEPSRAALLLGERR